jgi:hypothetical protein
MEKRCNYCKIYRIFDENELSEKLIYEEKFYCDLECAKNKILESLQN